ncbi:hypothetical protein AR687_03775 [Flavobacteriaceae bacterium CRH]|nr:hypothetical protein AR687_03775 [Flavobacteriaceae bacterium CRH]
MLLGTVSCDSEDYVVITPAVAPTLLSPETGFSIVLTEANANDVAIELNWDAAEYDGPQTVINYSVEIAKGGTNFAAPVTVTTTTQLTKSLTVGELNTALINGGFTLNEVNDIDIRVKSIIGKSGVAQNSKANTIKVTPYSAWPNWGLIGSATPNGWNDPDTNLEYDLSTKKYSYTGPLQVGEYKFRLDDKWATNYGDDGNNLSLEIGGANIPVTVAGDYTIIVDFTAKAYTITKN